MKNLSTEVPSTTPTENPPPEAKSQLKTHSKQRARYSLFGRPILSQKSAQFRQTFSECSLAMQSKVFKASNTIELPIVFATTLTFKRMLCTFTFTIFHVIRIFGA